MLMWSHVLFFPGFSELVAFCSYWSPLFWFTPVKDLQSSSRGETKAFITISGSLKLKTASGYFVDDKNRTGPAPDVIIKTEAELKFFTTGLMLLAVAPRYRFHLSMQVL